MTGADAGERRCGGPEWWCAIPDLETTASEAKISITAEVLARHPSGRPWIIGHQHPRAVRIVEEGPVRAAVVGDCLVSDGRLAEAARCGLVDLLGLPGSFHAVLTGPSGMLAAGDVAGYRRLFTTRATGVPVVASSGDVLRRMTGAPVDRTWLAARLASPDMPSVLRERLSPFSGVDPVPPGWWVRITDRSCRVGRWWTPPEPDRSLAEGADVFREALATAVTGRIGRGNGPVGVQLSGGLDSTTLAFLAAPAKPFLVTTAGRSPVDEDLRCARRVAEHLPGAVHRIVSPDEAPEFFAELERALPGLDEPAPFAAGAARVRYVAGLLAEHGTALHLNGQGGDEVLLAPLAYLRTAIRVDPRIGWRHLRGQAALRNVPLWTIAREVLRNDSFAGWLRRCVTTLHDEALSAVAVAGWEAPPILPPWASPEATELVHSAVLAAAPVPIAEDRTTHAAMARIRASAYRAALYRDVLLASGVPAAMPFFDRSVLEACLAVHPWQRTDPWQPKPLLHSAFRGRAPDWLLSRRTKSHYNADIHHGWTKRRQRLIEWLDRPALAEQYGLIDPATLRRALAGFGPSGLAPAWLTEVVAIERWLRDLAPAVTPKTGRVTPASTPHPAVRPSRAPVPLARGVSKARVDDGLTLIDGRRGTVYHLNPAAAAIVEDLSVGGIEQAAAMLSARCGIAEERARADVIALVNDLRRRRLVRHP